jgi:DNA polymerase V
MTRGGKRPGAGRPKGTNLWGESTKALRIPESRVSEVIAFLEGQSVMAIPRYACKIQAGFPSPADDYIEAHLDLNTHLIKHPAATFFVTATGDSMTGAGIESGDLLIVDRSLPATHGKIVIAALDGELTVKRLSRDKQTLRLLPANARYSAIEITDERNLVIWGVVIYVIHEAR